MTQLILTHHYWAKALDDGCHVDVTFLDFSKAFNRMSQSVLLFKRRIYAILRFSRNHTALLLTKKVD